MLTLLRLERAAPYPAEVPLAPIATQVIEAVNLIELAITTAPEAFRRPLLKSIMTTIGEGRL